MNKNIIYKIKTYSTKLVMISVVIFN